MFCAGVVVERLPAAARLRDRRLDVGVRAAVGQDPRALPRERREGLVADRRGEPLVCSRARAPAGALAGRARRSRLLLGLVGSTSGDPDVLALGDLPLTSSIAYQVPFGSGELEARFESIVAEYGFVTAPTNLKLGVRHSIFTVFAPVGGTRKWKRTQSACGAEGRPAPRSRPSPC